MMVCSHILSHRSGGSLEATSRCGCCCCDTDRERVAAGPSASDKSESRIAMAATALNQLVSVCTALEFFKRLKTVISAVLIDLEVI